PGDEHPLLELMAVRAAAAADPLLLGGLDEGIRDLAEGLAPELVVVREHRARLGASGLGPAVDPRIGLPAVLAVDAAGLRVEELDREDALDRHRSDGSGGAGATQGAAARGSARIAVIDGIARPRGS